MSLFSAVDVTVPRDKNPKVGPPPPAPLTFFAKGATCDKSNSGAMARCPLANGEFKGDCEVIHSGGRSAGELPYI